MLDQIKFFYQQYLALSAPEDSSEVKLQLATAALYLEMMHIGDALDSKDHEIILALIQQNYSLTDEQTTALMALAEQQRTQAVDYFQFTSLINKEYSLEQKVHLIESLWKIAFVDGVLDMNEEYLVRKIADLLHVPHTAFIMTKNRIGPERSCA
ncbi:MAG: TerB family tellurite resistance protein [Methylococcaceae bacterium]